MALRKIRHDIPSLSDLHDAIELAPVDRREGLWSKLELIEMDARFCAAMRREHPETEQRGESAEPEVRATLDRRQGAPRRRWEGLLGP